MGSNPTSGTRLRSPLRSELRPGDRCLAPLLFKLHRPPVTGGFVSRSRLPGELGKGAVLIVSLVVPIPGAVQEAQVDRTELPVKGPWYPPITTLDARDAKTPSPFEVRAPDGARQQWNHETTVVNNLSIPSEQCLEVFQVKTRMLFAAMSVIIVMGCSNSNTTTAGSSAVPNKMDRTVLPIQPPPPTVVTEMDARDATKPERFEIKPPEGSPNVVIVLIDDIGFGATEPFGGSIETPTFDRLADEGLRFNHFHTTALCSPTRAALLSGRNHHEVNVGSVMEVATGFAGNQGERPDNAKYVAETLRQNGYSTAAFGKWHETPTWGVSVSGPYFRWPTNSGFDKFYGFIGGETNQWDPVIFDGVTTVPKKDDPDYHFTTT